MNELSVKENIKIENMIYEIRGKQVMLDRDLAKLYHVETRSLLQSVKRNINRFPDQFMFQLTNDEFKNWKSQIVMSKNDLIGLRRAPYAFTEQGVAMLSGILHSNIAVNTSISIMNAFVNMRRYISNNLLKQNYYNDMVIRHDSEIKLLQESFEKFEEKKKVNEIYFNGQIYDAYSKIIEIFKNCKKELIIIDNYADNIILNIIKKLSIKVILITKENNLLTKQDIQKYNKQYNNLKVIYNNTFHDRYFILDNKIIYHCGASINRIGYKTFSITLLQDIDVINVLLYKIKRLTSNKN